MTTPSSVGTTAPVLDLAIDVSREPTLDEVNGLLKAINDLWLYARRLAGVVDEPEPPFAHLLGSPPSVSVNRLLRLLHVDRRLRESGSVEVALRNELLRRQATPERERDALQWELRFWTDAEIQATLDAIRAGWHLNMIVEDLERLKNRRTALVIKRMSLASPWEALLTTAADKSAPVLYAGAALVALERLLHMIMDWQRHRADMAERRKALKTTADRDQAVALLRQHQQEHRASDESGSADPAADAGDVVTAVATLGRYRIVRAAIRPDDPSG